MPKLRKIEFEDDDPDLRVSFGSIPSLATLSGPLSRKQFSCDWSVLTQLKDLRSNTSIDAERLEKILIASQEVHCFCAYAPIPNFQQVLPQIPSLYGLKELSLKEVTEEAFGKIAFHCPRLEDLCLSDSPEITGESLKEIASQRKKLWKLCLYESEAITDVGLKEICRLYPSLRDLCLGKTHITDAGLEKLAACPQLNCFSFSSTNVTEEGIRAVIPSHKDLVALRWKEAPPEVKSYLYWTVGISC